MAIYFNSEKGTPIRKSAIHYTKKDARPFTTFNISDPIRGNGAPDKTYAYYSCTVWDEAIPLQDGDRVSISPTAINSGWYNGKPTVNISCTIEIISRAGDFTPPTEEYIAPKTEKFTPKEEVFVPKSENLAKQESFTATTAKVIYDGKTLEQMTEEDYRKALIEADPDLLPFDL